MIYYFAIFPISLFTFFALLSLSFFIRKHYVLAGLAGAVCCWAFYSGPLIIGVLVVAAILVERGPQIWQVVAQSAGIALRRVRRPPRRQPLVGRELDGLSLGAGEVRQRPAQPRGDVHCRLHREPAGPVRSIQDPNIGYTHTYPQAQTAFVALLVIGLIVWTLRRAPVSRADWVILSYTVLFWLAPLVDGTQALPLPHRGVADPVCRRCAATRLPRVVQVVLVAVGAVLAVGMTTLFTQSILT